MCVCVCVYISVNSNLMPQFIDWFIQQIHHENVIHFIVVTKRQGYYNIIVYLSCILGIVTNEITIHALLTTFYYL